MSSGRKNHAFYREKQSCAAETCLLTDTGDFVWTEEEEEEATIQRLKSRITFFFSIWAKIYIYIYTAIRKEKTGFQVYENDLGLFFLDVNENFFLGGDDDFPNNNTGKNNIEFVPRFKGMKLGENKYLALVIYMEGRL